MPGTLVVIIEKEEIVRIPKQLSPTSISLFYEDRRRFYLKYLADSRCPRDPQTPPMALGSSFDAHVKSFLAGYDLETIFKQQVDEPMREWAWTNGARAFRLYQDSGALEALEKEMDQFSIAPRFEFDVVGHVNGVPLGGKPDLWYGHRGGAHVLLDWKCNGYCSSRPMSPKKGYIHRFDTKMAHKNCIPVEYKGYLINSAAPMNTVDTSWANQLSIYAWLLGESIGSNFVVGIEQLCGPDCLCVSHRSLIEPEYQEALVRKMTYMWHLIQQGPRHIFDTVSEEESEEECAVLDKYYLSFQGEYAFLS
jgi:hypothetical protein